MREVKYIILAIALYSSFPVLSSPGDDLTAELAAIENSMLTEGDYSEAVGKLRLMLGRGDDPRVLIDIGIGYYGLMEYDRAYRYFKEAGRRFPAVEQREMLKWIIGSMDENRGLLERIEASSGKEPGAGIQEEELTALHFTLLTYLTGDGHFYPSLVVPHIKWLKKNAPELEGLNVFSADVYYFSMLYEQAERDYRKALEEDPRNIRLLTRLGDCLAALGKYGKAEDVYEEAIEGYREEGLADGSPEILGIESVRRSFPGTYEDVIELLKSGDHDEAEKICRKRLSLNPGDHTATVQLGQIYWEKGERGKAIKIFRKVIKRSPEYPAPYFHLGKAYVFERKPHKAFRNFALYESKMDAFEEKDEEDIEAYAAALRYISHMHTLYGTREGALKTARKAVRLDPEGTVGHYNLAVIYYNEFHDRSKAYAELRKVIELKPGSRIARMAEVYIDYMRRNPDPRVISDFNSFYEE
ncbi:MAG: tetratricopeptide repeat protein [Candidatus Omnitrophica bacterium]|nr:tetratricopeptide repeat protein [Candidatus Omnitrophota bacterium]